MYSPLFALQYCTSWHNAIAGFMSGTQPVMHHNFGRTRNHISNSHVAQKTGIALMGPLTSFLQGLIAGSWFIMTKKRGPLQLFILWLSVLGFKQFSWVCDDGTRISGGRYWKNISFIEYSGNSSNLQCNIGSCGIAFGSLSDEQAVFGVFI